MDTTRSSLIDSFFQFIEIIPFVLVIFVQLLMSFIAMCFIGIGFLLISATDWIQRKLT